MAWEPLFSKIAEQAACSTGILCFAWENVSFFGFSPDLGKQPGFKTYLHELIGFCLF